MADLRHPAGGPERLRALQWKDDHQRCHRGPDGDRLRFIHLGRIDPVKGTDLLIRTFRAAWAADIDLDIYGVVQDDASGLLDRLQSLAAGDARIRFLPPIPPSQVIGTIASYFYQSSNDSGYATRAVFNVRHGDAMVPGLEAANSIAVQRRHHVGGSVDRQGRDVPTAGVFTQPRRFMRTSAGYNDPCATRKTSLDMR